MPEFNQRRVVQGLKQGAKEFENYVGHRLNAERSSEDIEKTLKQLERDAERARREIERGP